MNIQILHKKDNALFHRKEVSFELTFESVTPSRLEITKELAKQNNTKEECVVVKSIRNHYGKRDAVVIAHIYDSGEHAKVVETKQTLFRHLSKEEKEKSKEEKKAAKQQKAAAAKPKAKA
jgi:ribosomal protein S24E